MRSWGLFHGGRPYVWGLLDQSVSSATNLALTLVAARAVGPRGLGVVAVSFGAYVLVVTVAGALVGEPLVVRSSAAPAGQRRVETRAAAEVTLVIALVAASVCAGLGVVLDGAVGLGLGALAVWLPGLLLQQLCRLCLFRDGRGSAALATDLAWASSMALLCVALLASPSPVRVVAAWGGGASLAALLGAYQLRLGWGRAQGVSWFARSAWKLGSWSSAARVGHSIGYDLVLVVLPALVGAASAGAYRVALTVAAPTTLLGPAVTLPGLPALAALASSDLQAAQRRAAALSAAIAVPTGLYVTTVLFAAQPLLTWLFGPRFGIAAPLVPPVAVWALAVAAGSGSFLLLKAQRRVRALFTVRAAQGVATFVAALLFAPTSGVSGVAWVVALGEAGAALASWLLVWGRVADLSLGRASTREAS